MEIVIIGAIAGTLVIGMACEAIDRASERKYRDSVEKARMQKELDLLRAENECLRYRASSKGTHETRIRDDVIAELEQEIDRKDKVIENLKRGLEKK